MKNKTKCNLFQWTIWCYDETEGWKTKSCVVHAKKEEAQQSVWFPQKTTANYLGDWGEEKWDKKVSESNFFWEEKKNSPAALINACRKQSSRFALMHWSFHACYSSWSACFPWLRHDSSANTLQHSAQHRPTHHSLTLVLLRKRAKNVI